MRDAMIRNTRAVVALKLPRRHASTRYVDARPREQAAYQELAALTRDLVADGQQAGNACQLTICSAPRAPRPPPPPQRSSASPPGTTAISAWLALAKRWEALGPGGKEAGAARIARPQSRGEEARLHPPSRDDVEPGGLARSQQASDSPASTGSLSGPDKDAAIADFRDRVPVLLCTESGGEGRNIQFCNTLINFDIPWNPMAIEQRIGRIDRIGQSREVFVFNLVARGTVEEQVLRLLDEKINMFELVVGEAGAILGELDEERNFADLVLDAWLETTTPGGPRRSTRSAAGSTKRGANTATPRRSTRPCSAKTSRPRSAREARTMTRLARFRRRPDGAGRRRSRDPGARRPGVIAPPEIRAAFGWPELARLGFGADCPAGARRIGIESEWLDRFGDVARRPRAPRRAADPCMTCRRR